MKEPVIWKKVTTRGDEKYNAWVTKYKIQYSDDGQKFSHYNNQEEFNANENGKDNVDVLLKTPIKSKIIRIHPTA